MAGPYLFDRVRDTTTTTGTGTLTLANSPPSAHQAFSVVGNGNTCFYGLAHQSADEWEVGIGTYASSGTTLARTTVLAGKNGTSAVSLSSGTKDVFLVSPADVANRFLHVTNTVANLAAYQAGRLLFPSDGMFLYRDTGSELAPWGPIYPFTAPVSGDYSWVNQGSGSVSTTYGGIFFKVPTITPGASTYSLRLRVKSKTGSYKVTMAFLPNFSGPLARGGFCWRESSTGKLVTFGAECRDTPQGVVLSSYKWTTEVLYNSAYLAQGEGCFNYSPVWLQAEVDGSNRYMRSSADGRNWITLHTVGNTDFMTANQVGFWLDNPFTSYESAMTLLHWKEE